MVMEGVVMAALARPPPLPAATAQEPPSQTAGRPEISTLAVGEVVGGEVRADLPIVQTKALDETSTDAPVRGVCYRLELRRGPVTIELRSWFFDAYLVVRDAASGEVLAEDDDGLLTTHARVVLANDQDRRDVVVAVCALHGELGAYELRAIAGVQAPIIDEAKAAAEPADARARVAALDAPPGAENLALATALETLGFECWRRKRFGEAEAAFARAVPIRERLDGPESASVLGARRNLAVQHEALGCFDEEFREYERIRAIVEKAAGPDSLELLEAQCASANALRHSRRYEEARVRFEELLPRCERGAGRWAGAPENRHVSRPSRGGARARGSVRDGAGAGDSCPGDHGGA